MKIVISLAFFVLALSAASACDKDKIAKCAATFATDMGKAKTASAAAASGDKEKMRKKLCGVLGAYTKCLAPAIKSCSADSVNALKKIVAAFNKKPFNCDITLNRAGATTATLVTIIASVFVALKFF